MDFNFISIIFIAILFILAFYDLKYKAVPDYLLLAILILSFFVSSFSLIEAFTNALLAIGFFWLLNFFVTFYIQNIKSRIYKDESLKAQNALGEGDLPAIGSFAVVLGIEALIYVMIFSSIIAIIQASYLKIKKNDLIIPFIPSLVCGFLLEYFLKISYYFKGLF